MKKYELKYTEGEAGVFRMSTVESPATKTQLVMFDDEKALLHFADDEKKVIYSVAMRPNMLIPRKNINGEPAMVFYTEDTVNSLQQNFFKNNSHNGATVNHDNKVRNDMYCFESWIVDNPEKDKATEMGLQVQKGDWVLGQKVDNPEVWKDIKSGKLHGFSIEAYLEPVLTTNNDIKMTIEEIDERIKAVLMSQEDKTPLIAEDPIVVEAEALPIAPAPQDDMQKKMDELTAENADLKAKLAEYEAKATEMSAEIAATKKVALEMSEELEKGIKPNPVVATKKYEEMTNFEKSKHNRGLI
jgi:cell division protein FtsB